MTVAVISKPSLASTFSKEESACWTSGPLTALPVPPQELQLLCQSSHLEMGRSSPCFACHLPVLHMGATGRHLRASQPEGEHASPMVLRLAILGIVDPPAHLPGSCQAHSWEGGHVVQGKKELGLHTCNRIPFVCPREDCCLFIWDWLSPAETQGVYVPWPAPPVHLSDSSTERVG